MKKQIITLSIILSAMTINAQKPLAKSEVFATVNQAVGNIAYTNEGDLVYSHHPFFGPEIRVVKFDKKNKYDHTIPKFGMEHPKRHG